MRNFNYRYNPPKRRRSKQKFLEEHPEEVKVSMDTPIGFGTISKFLGWKESRVRYSLERLKLIEEDITDADLIRCIEVLDKRKKQGERTDLKQTSSASKQSSEPSRNNTASILNIGASKVSDLRTIVDSKDAEIKQQVESGEKSVKKAAIEQRQNIAQKLHELQVSQRATAKLLGVTHTTIQRDTGTNMPPDELPGFAISGQAHSAETGAGGNSEAGRHWK